MTLEERDELVGCVAELWRLEAHVVPLLANWHAIRRSWTVHDVELNAAYAIRLGHYGRRVLAVLERQADEAARDAIELVLDKLVDAAAAPFLECECRHVRASHAGGACGALVASAAGLVRCDCDGFRLRGAGGRGGKIAGVPGG